MIATVVENYNKSNKPKMVALQRVSNDTRHLGRNENYRIKYPRIFYTF